MKRNKNILLLVVVAAVLAVAAVVIFKGNPRDTLDKDSRDFTYADTGAVTKIFMADKVGNKVSLERNEKGIWMVNNKFPARRDGIILILKTLKYVEVKYPVSEKARKTVVKDLATGAIKVEFYKGNDPVKIFYVGGETQDHTGTYMLLSNHKTGENFEAPYVMGLPGFEGYLTPRFSTKENEWRDTKCMDFTPPQISNVKMEITGKPDSSFMIKVIDTKNLQLCDIKGNPVKYPHDPAAVKQFVAYLQNIHYEKLLTGEMDSVTTAVRNGIPFATLTIVEKSGKPNVYSFFYKAIVPGQAEKYGITSDYDPDRLFLEYNDRKDFAIIQWYVFGKILQTKDYFIPKPTVKK
jgi:hypothetical protein